MNTGTKHGLLLGGGSKFWGLSVSPWKNQRLSMVGWRWNENAGYNSIAYPHACKL